MSLNSAGVEKNEIYIGPAIIIAGPTGSGKTAVGIELAKELKKIGFNAAIISADSRAIYKGCDLGTAKPTREERGSIAHFGFDLVEVGEDYSVADFKIYAEEKIEEIRRRGAIPIVLGGTGLYVDALFYGYGFEVERGRRAVDREEGCMNYLFIGIKTDRDVLRNRLRERLNKIFVQELYEELSGLLRQHPEAERVFSGDKKEINERDFRKKYKALTGNVYRFAYEVMRGRMTEEEAKEKAFYADWGLARRQMTWFRRNKQIVWLGVDEVVSYVIKSIQNEQRK